MTERMRSNDTIFLKKSRMMIFPDASQDFKNDPDPRRGILKAIVSESLLISDLQPFFKYIFSMYMSNFAGDGPVTSSEVIFLPGRGNECYCYPSS